jgi:hypothetical protein
VALIKFLAAKYVSTRGFINLLALIQSKHMLLECANWQDLGLKLLMSLLEGVDDRVALLLLGSEVGPTHSRLVQWAGECGFVVQNVNDLLQYMPVDKLRSPMHACV